MEMWFSHKYRFSGSLSDYIQIESGIIFKSCQQPRQLVASSFPLQQLFFVNPTAAEAFSGVPSSLCIKDERDSYAVITKLLLDIKGGRVECLYKGIREQTCNEARYSCFLCTLEHEAEEGATFSYTKDSLQKHDACIGYHGGKVLSPYDSLDTRNWLPCTQKHAPGDRAFSSTAKQDQEI